MRFLIPLLRNWSWLSRESRGLVVRCAANKGTSQLSPSPNTQRVDRQLSRHPSLEVNGMGLGSMEGDGVGGGG